MWRTHCITGLEHMHSWSHANPYTLPPLQKKLAWLADTDAVENVRHRWTWVQAQDVLVTIPTPWPLHTKAGNTCWSWSCGEWNASSEWGTCLVAARQPLDAGMGGGMNTAVVWWDRGWRRWKRMREHPCTGPWGCWDEAGAQSLVIAVVQSECFLIWTLLCPVAKCCVPGQREKQNMLG